MGLHAVFERIDYLPVKERSMEIWTKISAWFDSTHLHQQIKDVDYMGLFTNPWFIVPFGLLVGYMFFKQNWKDLIIVFIMVGEIQIEKILPVIFGGAAALGLVVYLLFGRSD
jgi:hypothetical protein